jgi:2-hydroxy-6-oxonona-2,4-dienedioate hydrolase
MADDAFGSGRKGDGVDGAKFAEVDGITTRYFEAGSGEPVLLIHGGSFGHIENAEDWELNFDGLADQCHILAFDKVGNGFSDNPVDETGYLIGTTVDHAYGMVRTLDLPPVHVVGHSRGGYTAARLAIEHPEIVRSLVIVDSSTLMAPHNPQYDTWDREASQISDARERIRYLIAANSFDAGHITERMIDVAMEIEALPKTSEARRIMDSGAKARNNADLVERQAETHSWIRAGTLRCPTLIVWGFNDRSAPFDRVGIPCMNLILPAVPRSALHVLNRAGHNSFREQPEEFNRVLLTFVRSQRAADPAGEP